MRNVLLLGLRSRKIPATLMKVQSWSLSRRRFPSRDGKANRMRTNRSGATNPGPTSRSDQIRTRELSVSGSSSLDLMLCLSPMEITSKKPVTRRRQIVEVPKAVRALAIYSMPYIDTCFRKCGIHGSSHLQENSSPICIDNRTASSQKCTKRNFRL